MCRHTLVVLSNFKLFPVHLTNTWHIDKREKEWCQQTSGGVSHFNEFFFFSYLCAAQPKTGFFVYYLIFWKIFLFALPPLPRVLYKKWNYAQWTCVVMCDTSCFVCFVSFCFNKQKEQMFDVIFFLILIFLQPFFNDSVELTTTHYPLVWLSKNS